MTKNKLTNHSARAYTAFNRVIERCLLWMIHEIPTLYKFDKDVVNDRLSQSVIESSRLSYLTQYAKQLSEGLDLDTPEHDILNIGTVKIDTQSGKIRIKPLNFLRQAVIYYFLWLRVLFSRNTL